MRSEWALIVSCFWQSGMDQTLTAPLHAPLASRVPSGENWHAAIGLSSPTSELWLTMVPRVFAARRAEGWSAR